MQRHGRVLVQVRREVGKRPSTFTADIDEEQGGVASLPQ